MPGGLRVQPLLLVSHRLNRRSGHIGDMRAMVRGLYGLSSVVREREVKRPAGFPRLGLRVGHTKGAWRIPGS
jgi:hypothetical protein